jgi:ribokinase
MPDIRKYDVLVIGSLNADLVVRTPRFPQPGETISGEDLQVIPGGKGANQAVAAARQGVSVAMAGRVGRDSFGSFLMDGLQSNQVDASHVLRNDAGTGAAIIVVDSSGQNSIVLSPGANGRVTPQDVDTLNLDARILLLQLEIPLETVIHAAKWGRSKRMIVILNPAPARDLPDELISSADYLLPNETELNSLSGGSANDIPSAEKAARVLLERGAGNVIVTLGENGALIVNNTITRHVPAFKVDVVDTTAAGDAFIGGFASALFRGMGLEDSVRVATACGALATTKFGAQPSLPAKEETERFMSLR